MNNTRRLRIAAVAVLLAAPAISSCGANFDPQTDRPYTPATGVNDRSGSVYVIDAQVVAAGKGSGTVVAALVNNDQRNPDKLTDVAGASAQGTQTKLSGGPIVIPAGGAYQLADTGEVSANGKQVVAGMFVRLTFSFQRGDDVTLDVPVVARTGNFTNVPVPSDSANPSKSAQPSSSAKPSASAKPSKSASS